MYYVMYGQDGDLWAECTDYDDAEEILQELTEDGEDAWICSD